MEQARDKNTVFEGQRAVTMAGLYVKVANARDALHKEVITFIGLSGSKHGFSEDFFDDTQKLAKRDYKEFFFWVEECCKDMKLFSSLLAINTPNKDLAEDAKDVFNFVDKHRSQVRARSQLFEGWRMIRLGKMDCFPLQYT